MSVAFLLVALAPLIAPTPLGGPLPLLSPRSWAQLRTRIELARFPPPDKAWTAWKQSLRYRDWQHDKRRMGPTAELIYADDIRRAEWVEKAWDLLTTAQAYRQSEEAARDYLERMRVHLGDDWYARGLMPPPAPDWFAVPE